MIEVFVTALQFAAVAAGILALIVGAMAFESWRYRRHRPPRQMRQPLAPRLFRRPSVCYVLESLEEPGVVKVGFSRRSGAARARELEAQHKKRLRVVYERRMPWACEVEARLHARLRSASWRVSWSRGLGGEWYRPTGGWRQMVALVQQIGVEVEREARRIQSWSENQRATERWLK